MNRIFVSSVASAILLLTPIVTQADTPDSCSWKTLTAINTSLKEAVVYNQENNLDQVKAYLGIMHHQIGLVNIETHFGDDCNSTFQARFNKLIQAYTSSNQTISDAELRDQHAAEIARQATQQIEQDQQRAQNDAAIASSNAAAQAAQEAQAEAARAAQAANRAATAATVGGILSLFGRQPQYVCNAYVCWWR